MGVVLRIVSILSILYVFLLGVKGLGDGFKLMGGDLLSTFFEATGDPFTALMVGILGTTLVQSSSVTTSMVVGLVAAPENPLPLSNAIPMIMGANIGTTVTNTVVSLAHMGRREEFRRAFSVALCHDFFNFITVVVFLPLEILTGYLEFTARLLASAAEDVGGYAFRSPLDTVLKAGLAPIENLAGTLGVSEQTEGIIIISVSAAFIFISLFLLVRTLKSAVQNRVEAFITGFLGRSALLSIFLGAVVTVMVQSSSITTSLLVPLAGAAIITLRQAFPITLGANIGTTVTALFASLAASGVNAQAGIVIALVHLLFNVSGTLLIYPVPAVRNVPLQAARWMAGVAVRSRRWALLYVFCIFYVLPAMFAFLNRALR